MERRSAGGLTVRDKWAAHSFSAKSAGHGKLESVKMLGPAGLTQAERKATAKRPPLPVGASFIRALYLLFLSFREESFFWTMPTKKPEKKYRGRPFMLRFDSVWLVLLTLVIALLFWRNATRSRTGLVAGVYYKNRLIDVIDLENPRPRQFSYPQNPAVVFSVQKDGSIAFVSSDCPDKVCVHSGYLKRSGDYAACLPNAFVLKVGEKQAIGEPEYRLGEEPAQEQKQGLHLPSVAGGDHPSTGRDLSDQKHRNEDRSEQPQVDIVQ